MFNRVRQFNKAIFPSLSKIDYEKIDKYLDKEERILFDSMLDYEKEHSYNIFCDIEESGEVEDKKTYCRLALLHDVGKGRKVYLFQRVLYALFKIGKGIAKHPEKGYELIKSKDIKLAKLILNHHTNNVGNKDMELFQKYDNRN